MDRRSVIRRYYQCYQDRDRETIRELLAPDLHHVSSFAEYRDRDEMLEAIWPAVGQSWAVNLEIFGKDSEFMVRYQVDARERPSMKMAEYIRFDGDRICEIEVYVGRRVED